MSKASLDRYAANLRTIAGAFTYPATPDLHPSWTMRPSPAISRSRRLQSRLAWLAIVLLVAMASLLAVPQARAAVIRWVQIGAVRIFFGGPTPEAPQAPTTATPMGDLRPQVAPASATPTEVASIPLSQLAGETTLDDAQTRAGFKILLPNYPSDLGSPDRVFVQDQGGAVVILAWISPDDQDRARLVLQELPSESWGVRKTQLETVISTTVDGQPAVWAVGPYVLFYRNGDMVEQRLVEGHVLIWERAGVTFRLESDLSLDQAVKVAQSLK